MLNSEVNYVSSLLNQRQTHDIILKLGNKIGSKRLHEILKATISAHGLVKIADETRYMTPGGLFLKLAKQGIFLSQYEKKEVFGRNSTI